jgi:CubicO group peptidase (beta-lactamase class C family)
MKKAKNINIKNPALIILILSLLHVGCNFDTSGQYTYHLPEKLNDGLDVGTLNEVNIDHKYIEAAVNNILADKFNEVHSILIFRNNELVVEEYFRGHKWQWDAPYHHGENVTWNRTMSHNIMSVTKSVTSACIGIAIDRGFIESVHQTIFDYLPEHKHLIANGKDKITIEHLLTMTSGLEWREWSAPYSSAENPTIGIWFQDKDPITFILEMPLIDEPGTDFNYSTGNMIILGEIIRNATNMTIDEFSSNYLFEPLGIDSSHWAIKCENGVDANNLMITPRAMIKFGATFLNKGVWNGIQIVPEQWVEKSANPFPGNLKINVPGEPSGRLGYSYSWWTKTYYKSGKRVNMYAASGFGGQHIMVLPELNSVVVFTGGNFVSKRPPFNILEHYIIRAIDLR